MSTTTLSDIGETLNAARRILIITHISPDGDAIGSLLGLAWLLGPELMAEGTGGGADDGTPAGAMRGTADAVQAGLTQRSLDLVCDDGVPAQYAFLPGARRVLNSPPPGPWDVVVGLDASDGLRLGKAFRPQEYGDAPVVVLDHHITNLRFGALNWVDPTAAATAQVLVHLADAMHAHLGREAATCLLTGLVTDTRGFRTSNVTRDVMATAARLMEMGADLSDITERALNYRPYSIIRLWGPALDAVQLNQQVIWTHITRQMRAAVDAPENSDIGLVSFLMEAPEANVAAVFTEKGDEQVEISFRAKPGYDVSGVALSLGGGGHPQASGCTIPGPLAAAEARVLPLLAAAAKGTR